MKRIIFGLALTLGVMANAQENYGEIVGKIIESEEEPIIGARVWVNTGTAILGSVSDHNGRFRISTVPPGTYEVNISFLGDTMRLQNNYVSPNGYCKVPDVIFDPKMLTTVIFFYNNPNEIKLDPGNEHMITLTPLDLKHNVNIQNPADLISNMTSDIQKSEDGELYFRGARKGEMVYLIDGVKTRDISKVPGVAIGGVSVYTGGIPAKYGDTTGGVVVMETKSYFDLYRAWKATQL